MFPALAFFAMLTFALSAFSLRLERWGVPALVLALAAGIVAGPSVAGWVDPGALAPSTVSLLEEVARFTLMVTLFGVALRLPPGYWRQNRRWVLAIIGIGMPIMFAVSTGILLLLGVPFLVALLIAASITPTDPVITTPIVTGPLAEKRIPRRMRLNMSSESGLNDGLGYLFVLLPILLLTRPVGEAWTTWAVHVVLWEVAVPVLGGLVVGWVAGLLLNAAAARGWTMSSSYLGYGVALAAGVLAVFRLVGTDAVLAVFVAGAAFSVALTDDMRRDLGAEVDALSRVIILPVFALIGTALPWAAWAGLGWTAPLVILAAIILRRLAGVWLTRPLYRRIHSRRETAVLAWVGPIGVSALFYACLAEDRTGDQTVFPAVTMAIALSVVLHGLTATPAASWLASRSASERMQHA